MPITYDSEPVRAAGKIIRMAPAGPIHRWRYTVGAAGVVEGMVETTL